MLAAHCENLVHARAQRAMLATWTALDGKRPGQVYLAFLAIEIGRPVAAARASIRIGCPNR